MSKLFKIGTLVGLSAIVIAAVFLAVPSALAQTPEPAQPPVGPGYGYGMRGGNGWMRAYQEMIHEAVADALGITEEELEQAVWEDGKTMWQLAEERGIDPIDVQEAMSEAREAALEQAVQDGVITQDQADWMLSRMASGYGPGMGGGNYGGGFGGGNRGGMMGPRS